MENENDPAKREAKDLYQMIRRLMLWEADDLS